MSSTSPPDPLAFPVILRLLAELAGGPEPISLADLMTATERSEAQLLAQVVRAEEAGLMRRIDGYVEATPAGRSLGEDVLEVRTRLRARDAKHHGRPYSDYAPRTWLPT